ncbi:MAG: protein kinase [Pirellulales bacterium]
MHLNCPNCQAEIEVIPEESVAFLTCSTCGSRINPSTLIDAEQTASFVPQPKRMIDEYELIELIGRGTFGEVWKARDTLLKTLVAIKLPREHHFHADAQELFLREARTMATLKHSNIVRVLRVINRPDVTAIVQDYIPGTSLAERLKNFPFEAPRSAVAFWEVVARAVEFANEAGVVHRDLKTANILLNEKLEPLVTDFGLAKANSAEFTVTERNDVVGNYAHMSPEQAAGRSRDATRRSDVYSLGSILYQLLAHRFPFMGEGSTMSHLKQTADPKPPSAFKPGIPRDLDTICLKALRRDPAERYATAAEFADDLRRWLDGRPIQARPTPAWERAWRWTKRNRALTGMGVLVGLLLILLGLNVFLKPPAEPASIVPETIVATDTRRDVSLLILQRNADQNGNLEPIPSPQDGRRAPSARVKFWLRDPETGALDGVHSPDIMNVGADGVARAKLFPGNYMVIAQIPNHGFHEVERLVPNLTAPIAGSFRLSRWSMAADGSIELPQIDVPPKNVVTRTMIEFPPNEEFNAGSRDLPSSPRHKVSIHGFYLDEREVTTSEWQEYMRRFGIKADGLPAMTLTSISYEQAADFAESYGKRLQTEIEYEYAATNCGQTQYPWGNEVVQLDKLDAESLVAADVSKHGIHGLASPPAEFTDSLLMAYPLDRAALIASRGHLQRIVRGGLPDSKITKTEQLDNLVFRRVAVPIYTSSFVNVGIRCARSTYPNLQGTSSRVALEE